LHCIPADVGDNDVVVDVDIVDALVLEAAVVGD